MTTVTVHYTVKALSAGEPALSSPPHPVSSRRVFFSSFFFSRFLSVCSAPDTLSLLSYTVFTRICLTFLLSFEFFLFIFFLGAGDNFLLFGFLSPVSPVGEGLLFLS